MSIRSVRIIEQINVKKARIKENKERRKHSIKSIYVSNKLVSELINLLIILFRFVFEQISS